MATVKKLISLDENIAKELENVADKITKKINSGDMKVYDSEEVYKELGIEL